MQDKTAIAFTHEMVHRDGRGRIIYQEKTNQKPLWDKYDLLRSRWCNTNRYAWCPSGFREGRHNIKCLIFWFYLRIFRR